MIPNMLGGFQLQESFSWLSQPSHRSRLRIPPHRFGIILQLISAEVINCIERHLEPARTDRPKDKLGHVEFGQWDM